MELGSMPEATGGEWLDWKLHEDRVLDPWAHRCLSQAPCTGPMHALGAQGMFTVGIRWSPDTHL